MKRPWLKRLLKLLAIPVLILVPLVVIPQLYDPLGVRFFDDAYEISDDLRCATDDCELLRMSEGVYTYASGWVVTTGAGGFRVTPSNMADCTLNVAVIGDSFVWGAMVSDEATWVNLLAQRFPQACFYNFGQYGYNADQSASTLDTFVPESMDYVLYFVFKNDDYTLFSLGEGAKNKPSPLYASRNLDMILWLLHYPHGTFELDAPRRDIDVFYAAVDHMARDPRMHFIGFESERLVSLIRERGYWVTGISVPPQDEQISLLDNHPTLLGHSHMADDLDAFITALLNGEA